MSVDLDVVVATKIMGQVPCERWKPNGLYVDRLCGHEHNRCYPVIETSQGKRSGIPQYSKKIHLALEVLSVIEEQKLISAERANELRAEASAESICWAALACWPETVKEAA